jgi:rfaE bifunctional protein kinase chain/domain
LSINRERSKLNLRALNLVNRESIASRKILVVGDVMLDKYWFGKVNRISGEAPVPIVHVDHEELRLGGAANVALNVKTLGANVTLITVVGKDNAAENLRDLIDGKKIKTYFSEDPNMETIVKLRIISQNQQMLRLDFEREPDIEVMNVMVQQFNELVADHDVVVFSDYGKGGLTHIPKMIHMAKKAGKFVLIDPKGSDWLRYSEASIITPNIFELTQVVGPWSCESQLRDKVNAIMQKFNFENLLLTRSKDGMTLFEPDSMISIPSEAREVADVSGAGDTVIATLAAMIACHLDLSQSMRIANKAAGHVVARFGTASVSFDELFGESINES